MNLGYVLLGFVIGGFLASGGSWMLLGAVGGAFVGALFGRMIKAERQLAELEARLHGHETFGVPGTAARDASSVAGQPPSDQADQAVPGQPRSEQPAASPANARSRVTGEVPAVEHAWPDQHRPPTTVGGLHRATHPKDGSPAGIHGTVPPEQPSATAGTGSARPAEGHEGVTPAAAASTTGGGEPFGSAGGDEPFEAPRRESRPSLAQVGLQRVSRWFTTGNVPVKLGVILSFIGVAFLLKYAIDRELLTVPIEFRLLAVAVGALAMLAVGWRLRGRLPVYALSLQGGAVGILFLTIFAAFRIWDLIPASLAFGLLVTLAAATGALAVLQSSRTLIVLGITGGFLAPVLASTGEGSHVALFSYYAVLNATILAVTWFRAWRQLNLLGWAFTFVIGTLWGWRYYRPELFASTEPFLVLFFVFYNAIAILHALRQPPERAGLVDGTLVFGTPVVAFALQAALVRDTEYGLAISAAVAAVFYAIIAVALFRRWGRPPREYLRLLTESYLSLAVAFATLTIPLALDARWTSAAWALEGAALVWIGTRQGRHLATLAGAGLVGFAGMAFFFAGWRHDFGWPVLNANVLGGMLIALSALFASRRLEGFAKAPVARLYPPLSWALFAWGVLWWFGTGLAEIGDRMPASLEPHAVLTYFAATALLCAWLGQGHRWCRAGQLTVLYLPALAAIALLYWTTSPYHFLYGAGWVAWPVAFAVQGWVLHRMDEEASALAAGWHAGSVLLAAWLLSVEASWHTAAMVAGDWHHAAAVAVPGFIALLILRWRESPGWPVPWHAVTYRGTAWALVSVQVLYLAQLSVERTGDPAPLAYLPVLNPFDLAMLYTLLIAWVTVRFIARERDLLEDSALWPWRHAFQGLLAVALFVITTAALVRGVHHVAGVPWRLDALARSEIVQTALSIYWGVLGFAGMVAGARRGLRPLWLAGAGFMGLVVLKLFLVDLGNSGTVERIVSFIGVGVLLLVVGYFAPVPPRHESSAGDSVSPEPDQPPEDVPPAPAEPARGTS